MNKPFWSSILRILPILKDNAFYQISAGHLSIWNTPWCEQWNNIYDALIFQQNNFIYPLQVKDLWLQNRKEWNANLIDNIFQEPMASCIKKTNIIDAQEEDILC